MKWSWRIGKLAGIELRVHATFVLLLAWLALVYFRATGTIGGVASGIAFTLALFVSVVLHELGHALVARRYGVPTRDITLLPIGGVARLEYIPEKPRAELSIALAGPMVTAALALVVFAVLRLLSVPLVFAPRARGVDAVAVQLMWANVTLLVFNLLPAFPMDGGRVLRALLALRMDYVRATRIAARAGQIFALFFGIVGLMYDPVLVVIALFVWVAAVAESGAVEMHSSLAGVDVERVMIRDARTLAPEDPLSTALAHVLDGFQQDFPVVRGGAVVGVLTRSALLAGVAKHGVASPVELSMDRSFAAAEPGEPVERAVARLHAAHCQTMPVVSGGLLRGVLTLENVGEFVAIAAALRKAPPKVAAGAAVV